MHEISEESLAKIGPRKATKNAWAAYVRKVWPLNTQAMVETHWNLSPGRANGVVWGNVSQPTIDQILSHKNGGPMLALKIEALAWGVDWTEFVRAAVAQELKEIRHEKRQLDAADERARGAWARLEAVRPDRRSAVRLVRSQDRETGGDLGGRG